METNKNSVENPNTAIASESESEITHSRQTTPVRRRRRRKHKEFHPDFNIPGVHKLILPELTQEYLGCVAGENVTVEKPWMNVDKDLIQEHLETHESSEFLPIKEQIVEFTGEEFLVGYVPDESNEYDEFYICVTKEATDQVNALIKKIKQKQEERLRNAVSRRIKKWKCLGSDKEVDEAMIKYNRSLIEVEIESKYPILPFKIHFRFVKAQDLRDGYMELRPAEETSTIFKKRIDAFVQVAPSVVSNEAQTVCTYPKNSYTQYEYEVPQISLEESQKYLRDFMAQNMSSFCDILKVNGCIDLYSNDYENLVLGDKYAVKVIIPRLREYYCFIDMNLCAGKMVSSAMWHPMWTGCLICSYVDIAPHLYLTSKLTTDEVYKAVHDTNPVLFWSMNDDLKPKLILETPRPIYTISCCPYDPNLIIGGCLNGQIIIWDITNKLYNVEEEEILTVKQQKYRDHMFSLMNWMKNIFDLALVRPTALSDLKYSHKGCINAISWMSPFYYLSKTGKIEEIEEDSPHSLQLMTSGEDGTIMIWDLLRKPIKTPGSFQGLRKIKRLKKRPSALSVMESPFKTLHLKLTPVYKINLINPSTRRMMAISSSYMYFFKTLYEPSTRESRKSLKLSDRLIFNPIVQPQNSITTKTFYVGTMEGDFIQATWEGQEFDSGEIVNFEDAQFIHYGRYHDGPVVSVDYSPLNDTILTVGGRIFALWRNIFPNRPILWRKSCSIYTSGSWFKSEQASLRLIRMDGYSEVWTLFYQSKSPLNIHLLSNGPINIVVPHPRKIKYNVIGLCDYRGSARLYHSPHISPVIIEAKEEYMSYFLTREIERKKTFLSWQDTWNQRHVSTIDDTEEKKEETIIETVQAKRKKEEKKKLAKISPGTRYLEMVQEQHRKNEQQRIKSIILLKKQLNTEDLLKKREPLRNLEEENEVKKRRQKNKFRESDRIFKGQVEMLFPDVVKPKPPPPIDPYEDCYNDESKKDNFNNYHVIASSAKNYVQEHPFSYDFSWGAVLKMGRDRRKKLDDSVGKHNHGSRFASVKEEKLTAAKVAEARRVATLEEASFASSHSRSTLATN